LVPQLLVLLLLLMCCSISARSLAQGNTGDGYEQYE
jgi:hypothetical protein